MSESKLRDMIENVSVVFFVIFILGFVLGITIGVWISELVYLIFFAISGVSFCISASLFVTTCIVDEIVIDR